MKIDLEGICKMEDRWASNIVAHTDVVLVMPFLKKHHGVIAGGFLRANHPDAPDTDEVQDIDCFFPSPEDALACVWDFASSLASAHTFNVRMSRAAVTLTRIDDADEEVPFQFIYAFTYTDIETLLSNFDFTVSQAAFSNGKFFYTPEFVKDIERGKIVFTGSGCPVQSLWRTYKYQKKGYRMQQSEMLKILEAIQAKMAEENKALEELGREYVD